MARTYPYEASVTAGQQFAGTELVIRSSNRPRTKLRVKEVLLQMGLEAKSWRIVRKDKDGTEHVIRRSTDTRGMAMANNDHQVYLSDDKV